MLGRRYRSSYGYNSRRRDWPKQDQDRLNALFAILRKQKLIARQNFSCCGSCAGSELATELGEKRDAGKWLDKLGCAFYHRQDTDSLKRTGTLYLRYGQVSCYGGEKEPKYKTKLSDVEVGNIIVEACKKLNMHYEWNGDPSQCILIDTNKDLVEPPPAFIGEGI